MDEIALIQLVEREKERKKLINEINELEYHMNPKVTEKLEKIRKKSEKPYLLITEAAAALISSSKCDNVG